MRKGEIIVKEKIEIKKPKALNLKEIIFVITSIVVIITFCIALTPVSFQNDTFYTIKIGEHILQNGIDMKDPFSWHENLPYTYPHWAYDVITYLIYNIFGLQGIYVATIILTCILGISLFFTNRSIGKNSIVAFLTTLGIIYLIRGYITARAQLVTFILFIFTVFFIEKFLETKKKRYAIALIIIPILIANLHCAVFPFYFVLYLPYIAEYIIAVLADIIIYKKIKILILKCKIKILSKESEKSKQLEETKTKLKDLQNKVDRIKIKRDKELQNPYKIRIKKNKNVKWLILIMIICIFTGLLTPLGSTPYTYLLKTMQGNTTKNINEHLPMTLGEEKEVLSVLALFLAFLTFSKSKIKLADLFMIGGLCYLMLITRRQVTMFLLIGGYVFNKTAVQLIEIYDFKLLKRDLSSKFGSVIILLVIIYTLFNAGKIAKRRKDDELVDATSYPVQACDYIIENIDLSKAKFYNEYNYGSYMLFRDIPVFIDSRADLYAPEFSGKEEDIFMDFIETSSISQFYEDVFEKYNITHIITYANSKMKMIIEKTNFPGYKELYKDDYFVIYERLPI